MNIDFILIFPIFRLMVEQTWTRKENESKTEQQQYSLASNVFLMILYMPTCIICRQYCVIVYFCLVFLLDIAFCAIYTICCHQTYM